MISEWAYDRANMMYSRGLLSFEELIAVIHGRVALEALEAERSMV